MPTDTTQQAQEKLREAARLGLRFQRRRKQIFRETPADGEHGGEPTYSAQLLRTIEERCYAEHAAELDHILGYSELLQQKEELLGALSTILPTMIGAHAHCRRKCFSESYNKLIDDAEAAIVRAEGGK